MKLYKGTVDPGEMNWQVTVDGQPLNPRYDLRNHSPDGFAWGYGGSGPAQLALAILADCTDDKTAQQYYQDFKFAVIGHLPQDENFVLAEAEVKNVLDTIKIRRGE
jgi:uncharacterized protein (DUF2249 family)